MTVLDEVAAEMDRQVEKWGIQNHPDGTGPTIPSLNREEQAKAATDFAAQNGTLTYRHILAEEYYEALAAPDKAKLRDELIQVAAVALSWAKKIDRGF